MPRVRMDTDLLHLEIDPALGASVARFDLREPGGLLLPLMRPAEEGATWFNDLACYSLAPWSNRIAGGEFTWRGQRHRLTPDWPDGTAIHGLVKDRPWRLIERSPVTAILEFASSDFPDLTYSWPFHAAVRYELLEDALAVRLSVKNLDSSRPMPAGLGFHPFFPRFLREPSEQAEIRYAALGRYPAQHMLPTRPAAPDDVMRRLNQGVPVGELDLDDVFLGSTSGATITWPRSGVRLTYGCSPALGHAVIYTGKPDSFCFEPVTMVNDGFNVRERGWQDNGVAELAPGEPLSVEWTVTVGTL